MLPGSVELHKPTPFHRRSNLHEFMLNMASQKDGQQWLPVSTHMHMEAHLAQDVFQAPCPNVQMKLPKALQSRLPDFGETSSLFKQAACQKMFAHLVRSTWSIGQHLPPVWTRG